MPRPRTNSRTEARLLGLFLVGLLLALLVAVFAIQNIAPVSIHLLFWAVPKVPLAVVLLIAILFGAALAAFLALVQRHQRQRRRPEQETALETAVDVPIMSDEVPPRDTETEL